MPNYEMNDAEREAFREACVRAGAPQDSMTVRFLFMSGLRFYKPPEPPNENDGRC
jgi:hypothetical protein